QGGDTIDTFDTLTPFRPLPPLYAPQARPGAVGRPFREASGARRKRRTHPLARATEIRQAFRPAARYNLLTVLSRLTVPFRLSRAPRCCPFVRGVLGFALA